MSRAPLRAPALAAAVLLLCGCVATQKDVLDLEQQTDEVKAQILDLKKTISSLQANQADLAVKMDQLHSDVNIFHESAKDSQDSMTRLSGKLDSLEAAMGRKVSSLGADLSKQQSELAAKLTAEQAAAEAARQEAQKAAEKAAAAAAAASETPGRLYHDAETALRRKEYDRAQQGFESYLQKFPKGEMADLATYFLGEAQYAQRSWEDAAREFATVLDHYPKSDITPSARLKYAVCLMNMKSHLAEAKRYLESIPEDFPKTPEAAAARKLLRKFPKTVTPK